MTFGTDLYMFTEHIHIKPLNNFVLRSLKKLSRKFKINDEIVYIYYIFQVQ